MDEIIARLFADGKGILAADESIHSATERLKAIDVESTYESRRQYRNLFFSSPQVEDYISGVILFEETLTQTDNDGKLFTELLTEKGIELGIKVDESTVAIPGSSNEMMTRGIDSLEKDLAAFKSLGTTFTKWRAVFTISDQTPTTEALEINMVLLSEYAHMVQDQGMVPILEPEVLLTGDHNLERAQEITTEVLSHLFEALAEYRVDLSHLILKTSMVVPGNLSDQKVNHHEIANATVKTLVATVPTNVPGVVFLSGGQSSDDAIQNLNAIAKLKPLPWKITFSYARALQTPALQAWQGNPNNIASAQKTFIETLKKVSRAQEGEL